MYMVQTCTTHGTCIQYTYTTHGTRYYHAWNTAVPPMKYACTCNTLACFRNHAGININPCTVFIRIVAAATINFSLAWVRLLIEGGFY